jgi:hypothetical protein
LLTLATLTATREAGQLGHGVAVASRPCGDAGPIFSRGRGGDLDHGGAIATGPVPSPLGDRT